MGVKKGVTRSPFTYIWKCPEFESVILLSISVDTVVSSLAFSIASAAFWRITYLYVIAPQQKTKHIKKKTKNSR